VALHGAFIISGAATVILGPLIAELSLRWALPVSIGTLFLIQFGACAVGAWISSGNPRRSVVLGYGLVCLGLCGLGLGGPAACVAMAVIGFGLGLSITSTNVLVARMNPDRRGAALNHVNLMWGIGAAACPLLFAALHPVGGGAPWVLAFFAALAWLAVACTTKPEPPTEAAAAVRVGPAAPWAALVLLTVQLFIYTGTESSIVGWIAKLCIETDPSHPAGAFVVNACFWGAFLGGRLIAPILLQRMRESTLHVAALALAGASAAGLLAAPSLASFAAGALLVGIGLAPLYPLLVSAVVGCTERTRSRAGAVFSIGGLGSGAVPWLAGQVAEATGSMRQAFFVPAIGVGLMALLLWRYRALPVVPPAPRRC
jgi:MFS transporter, FHS family, glucose/mannose:H+ symporter